MGTTAILSMYVCGQEASDYWTMRFNFLEDIVDTFNKQASKFLINSSMYVGQQLGKRSITDGII